MCELFCLLKIQLKLTAGRIFEADTIVLVKSLSGWNPVCFPGRPCMCSRGLVSHLSCDAWQWSRGHCITLVLFFSYCLSVREYNTLYYTKSNYQEPCSVFGMFGECFDQCCIPLLIYPVSPSKTSLLIQEVFLLMLEKFCKRPSNTLICQIHSTIQYFILASL